MRKTKEYNGGWKALTVLSSLILILLMGFLVEPFSIVSNAQSQARVVVRSAKIRAEANTSSEILGSVAQNDALTINNQVTASDNTIWYQVFVDADTLGYIRSDLVEITDGTTPPTSSETTTNSEPTQQPDNENMAEVTAVEPVSATVTGSESVRVRSNASTGSQIVTIADDGAALTVIGQANGTDGKIWYQVKFIAEGNEVTGFIRSDYVALSGELIPATTETTPPADETPQDTEVPESSTVVKDWDTQYVDSAWYLVDNINSERYDINNIFETVANNTLAVEQQQAIVEEQQATVKNYKVAIILLVIVLIVMAGAITMLLFKIKDMMDSAYFAEIEKETIRRRTADRPASGDKRVMHTVGSEKKQTATRTTGAPVQGGPRPANQRPAGAPPQGGSRPVNQRPTGTPPQGGPRPVNQRPAGAPAQGGLGPANQRPTGAPQQEGARPANLRPVGAPQQEGARPANPRAVGAPQEGSRQENYSEPAPKPQQNSATQNAGWQSKNFMTDEDEFEFEFLNWDGDEE